MNSNVVNFPSRGLTMSSREIAELTGKRHDHVMRDIKIMLEELGNNAPIFGAVYKDAKGENRPCFNLPKRETLILVSGYSVELRARIIDRWQELEKQVEEFDPATFFESPSAMRGLLLTYTEKVIAMEAQVDEMSEDVAAHQRLVKADGSLNITEAAKNLGVRPKDLFDWLSRNGWIYKRVNSPSWLGYQTKCNSGLLEHKSTIVSRGDGSDKVIEQVRITPKGLSVIAKLMPPQNRQLC